MKTSRTDVMVATFWFASAFLLMFASIATAALAVKLSFTIGAPAVLCLAPIAVVIFAFACLAFSAGDDVITYASIRA